MIHGWHNRLKEARKRLELSQEEMAARLDVSPRTYQGYEQGRSAPKMASMAILAELGFNLGWLAIGEGLMHTEDTPPPRHTDAGLEPIDEELMGRIVDGISKVYKEEGVRIPPVDLGRLAQRLANQLAETYEDPEDRPVGLKLLLTGLRKDLAATAGALETETKHRA
jgi:transcriptional regulator with XRE-family HTH domain